MVDDGVFVLTLPIDAVKEFRFDAAIDSAVPCALLLDIASSLTAKFEKQEPGTVSLSVVS